MPEMTITPLTPAIGAEISGIDLSQPVDSATREKLSVALAEHLALVFHDQSLTPEQYLAAENLRPPDAAALFAAPHAGLSRYRACLAPQRPAAGRALAYRSHEPRAPAGRDDIVRRRDPVERRRHQRPHDARRLHRVAGGRAAPSRGLRTVNSLDTGKNDTLAEDWEKYSKPIVHPMVRTHPVHGSRAVFFHITKTLHVEGMSPEASRAYLSDLIAR